MNIISHILKSFPSGLKPWGLLLLSALCPFAYAGAQITIGGNVYGGGDMATVNGNTAVQVVSGDLEGSVFAGARMADIQGNAFVHIDGQTEGTANYAIINRVYGGNDISGHIGTDKTKAASTVPQELTDATGDGVDATWDAFVHISNGKKTDTTDDIKQIFIGQLFGGGNGDYEYETTSQTVQGVTTYTHTVKKLNADGTETVVAQKQNDDEDNGYNVPDLARTYIDLHGATTVYAYGGGNKATITDQTVICVDNNSNVVTSITDAGGNEMITASRLASMGVSSYTQSTYDEFQIGRLFGGNNLAEMDIRPTWHLEGGSIRNAYSGGNRGDMTNVEGLLLEIHENSRIVIDNLYGGCRMADVHPLKPGTRQDAEPGDIQLSDKDAQGHDIYRFPAGLAARVLVRGGDVNNVYGGNDITGHVTGGNAVGVYAKIRGDVYGGGNGSYPYTDNPALKENPIYSDYYYDPDQVLTAAGVTVTDPNLKSVTALNLFRPDAEQVSIHLIGTEAKPTIISGSVYCGGNSATVRTTKANPRVELKMGSYVIADNIFMGNNGENMVKYNDALYDSNDKLLESEGVLKTFKSTVYNNTTYSSIDLTDQAQFALYMEGAAMNLMPSITFDSQEKGDRLDYEPFSSFIGSFYCGGNRGSMTYPGTHTMDMSASAVVYEKIVGGCNDAIIDEAQGYNAVYYGGILGSAAERVEDQNGKTAYEGQDRLVLNLNGVKIEPKRWALKRDQNGVTYLKENGDYVQDVDANGLPYLEWNTVGLDDNDDLVPVYYKDRTWATVENGTAQEIADASDAGRRLAGGNIYGGCHESGIVNGNVVININDDVNVRERLFAQDQEVGDSQDNYIIKPGVTPDSEGYKSGVILYNQAFDVLSVAMTVFGGGYGEDTEIWGSTQINLNQGFAFQIFGGGHAGVIGKKDSNGDYYYDHAYSTTVNLNGLNAGYSTDITNGPVLAESEYIYGAGNEGDVCGDSYVNLGNGRIYDSFGGASDADVYGHVETTIGFGGGFPWVRDIVYGGNDFGGTIHGECSNNFWDRVTDYAKPMVHGADPTDLTFVPHVVQSKSYVEYLQGRVDTIFGGNYGNYPYEDPAYYDDEGHQVSMPYLHSSFVNIRPVSNANNAINAVFGGSTGHLGNREGDKSQDHSYVLIDIPDGMDNFSSMEIFGSGSYSGLGMRETVLPKHNAIPADDPGQNGTEEEKAAYRKYQEYLAYLDEVDEASAVIDLVRGNVGAAYGGSYNEGITRRSLVNVPQGSTIMIGSIFGGAYGNVTLSPCDVYEANVEYHSADATLKYNPLRIIHKDGTETLAGFNPEKEIELASGETLAGNLLDKGAIYGGNNFRRRTLYGRVTIDVKLNQQSYKYGATTGYVYGAGCGENTWSEYTEVNLKDGAQVWEVYGGGQNGLVINAPSIQKYINEFYTVQGLNTYTDPRWEEGWTLGGAYDEGISIEFTENRQFKFYAENTYTNLNNPLVTPRIEFGNQRFNTNVIIGQNAVVDNYAYGAGLGSKELPGSGDVYGTSYIALLGGSVNKDIYAAGTSGNVCDQFGVGEVSAGNPNGFTASTTAYIEGGTVRNVYGGGWEGNVGKLAYDQNDTDIPGQTNVIIGIRAELDNAVTYDRGVPAIQRNAYAGGEGGSVIGAANITVNNGYIGYAYLPAGKNFGVQGKVVDDASKLTAWYAPKIDDDTYFENGVWKGSERLEECGNIFGSGYDDMSAVDVANVTLYGGTIRNSVFGGGEIATVGRGTNRNNSIQITKAGQTHVYMYNGNVLRNVFGGGKGYNILGYGGSNKLYTDGYVFGQTDVNIHGGVIGTVEGIANGDGNVFGGGDRGYVYSAYEYVDGQGQMHQGKGRKSGTRYNGTDEGFYYKYENGAFITDGNEKIMTEDCHVLIEPWLQVTAADGITYGTDHYDKWDYIPTAYLNTLPAKDKDATQWPAEWSGVDAGTPQHERGIVIYNAVFAGGNVSSGADMNAHTNTVFGNATATIHDVYNRDFITIGTGRTGGLYGDGNLTFVDGYRELNITNYGTDFYHIKEDINIDDYRLLPEREQAYYELKYKCIKSCTDIDGTTYAIGATIPQEQLFALFAGITYTDGEGTHNMIGNDGKPSSAYWVENGVLLRAPGRGMNTIQRADFCGVFGSRMVMQGAQDRVPETADYTNYTINRVREVSLNKKATSAGDTDENHDHGNYFGIYSVVNYLGALTSDVDFYNATRETDNGDQGTYGQEIDPATGQLQSYAAWKKKYIKERKRNNGSSYNQVALASGVYLELTTEQSTGTEVNQKDWGYITGIVELDLINVSTGLGGGFVYAKNEHGVRNVLNKQQVILSDLNQGAVTKKNFSYATPTAADNWQTSGNFVHSTQTIIDDCYNISGRYYDDPDHNIVSVPAHYWFIKGQIYVYDQVLSAYTGTPNAYREEVNIPLTISAGANGKMKLLDVKPSLYAYYSSVNGNNKTPLAADGKLVINDVTYSLNDPISYWDWYNLSKTEQKLFVDETYVVLEDCKIGNTTYNAGKVLLKSEYEALKPNGVKPTVTHRKTVNGVEQDVEVDFDYIFRSSNNLSHNTGYILTYNVNNPEAWDTWYTPKSSSTPVADKINSKQYNELTSGRDDYHDGPTYTPETTNLYGQRVYSPGDIITQDVYDTYNAAYSRLTNEQKAALHDQAVFERAYLTTEFVKATNLNGDEKRMQEGAKLAKSEFTTTDTWPTELQGKVAEAFVCTSTIRISQNEYITAGDLLTQAQKTAYITALNAQISQLQQGDSKIAELNALIADINNSVVPAYYNTSGNDKDYYFGGDFYEAGKNYRALSAWSSMSEADRSNFRFNYDAFDLLIDPTYSNFNPAQGVRTEGNKYQYDSKAATAQAAQSNKAGYSLSTSVDYTAKYNGTSLSYQKDDGTTATAVNGTELTRTEFERLPNEQGHYAPIVVSNAGTYYVVNTAFTHDEPFAVGEIISDKTYQKLSTSDPDERQYITTFTFGETDMGKTFYFCRDSYVIESQANGGHPVTSLYQVGSINEGTTLSYGATVPVGFVIAKGAEGNNAGCYTSLVNSQLNFTIHGTAPVETSTLYMTRSSDIHDLSKEKIITVIYQYDYTESDESGLNITPISERHVLNIHLQFKSGVPTVADINDPDIVLPGNSILLKAPSVTPGAYEIIGEGWEIFENDGYAESHTNGTEYQPMNDQLYWYQNGYYLAYYAKTYLGKTYSNYVPISVANYHDLKKVMDDTNYHLHIDYDWTKSKTDDKAKIYINNYTGKDGATLLKEFYDLTMVSLDNTVPVDDEGIMTSGTFQGHAKLNARVAGGTHLDFILRTNISHSGTWTPIGDNTKCFMGTLHGDGYTISGLDHSLFGTLCGEVYNLGVTGTFSTAGVADTGDGYVENCWISTTGTPDGTVYAVFGNPTDETDNRKQLINSYYPNTLGYKTQEPALAKDRRGIATPMPTQSFYNGEVAYNLNGFYLNKRYYDGRGQESGIQYVSYRYIDPTVSPAPEDGYSIGYYPQNIRYYAQYGDMGYVEERYRNGDFRFANATIPETVDKRQIQYTGTDDEPKIEYVPVWPDDYLFFGQSLTFGYEEQGHNDMPAHYNGQTNRVYRAPAYYGDSKVDVAYFNAAAVLPATVKNSNRAAYPGMTALDLTGARNDVTGSNTDYRQGTLAATQTSVAKFYAPLLDYDGLTRFRNDGQTQNMLVYVNKVTDNATATVIDAYFQEPLFSTYANADSYGSIRKISQTDNDNIHGHLVVKDAGGYHAANNHFLVDRQDFNAPISYAMGSRETAPNTYVDNIMWYQRQPEIYVQNAGSGWESVSLPFTAQNVVTSQKGIITHFYNGGNSGESHEYWLRTPDRIDSQDAAKILFKAVGNGTGTASSTTFLWDYYYNKNSRKDKNDDTYQQYYNTVKTYNNYPYAAAAQPYLIGFPGDRYYEFDLSGQFIAQNTATTAPAQLDKQTITFVSGSNEVIGVSDTDYETAVAVQGGSYLFKPTYQTKQLDGPTTWLLNSTTGTVFQNNDDATSKVSTVPFRAYIAATSGNNAPRRSAARAATLSLGYVDDQDNLEEKALESGLTIYSQDMNIYVESTLEYPAQITVTTAAGKQIRQFTIQPGSKVQIPVSSRGVYIVNHQKIAVTK